MATMTLPPSLAGTALFEQFCVLATNHDAKRPFVLGLSGQQGVAGFLSAWQADAAALNTRFYDCLEIFMLDESAFTTFMTLCGQYLLQQGFLGERQIHGQNTDAQEYSREFLKYALQGKADVVVLGVSEHGTLAGLVPGSEALLSDALFFNTHCVATPVLLTSAQRIWVVFTNDSAYAQFVDPTVAVMDAPAKILGEREDVLIIRYGR